LKGGSQTLALTFDREAANTDRSLALITPAHPLAQTAAQTFIGDDETLVALSAPARGLPPGPHPFAIYLWQVAGLRDDAVLVPVIADVEVARVFMELIAEAHDAEIPPADAASIEALESWHYDLWAARRDRHAAETEEIARFRRDSLEASHRGRMAVLSEQLANARDERIRRMRQGQIARASADHAAALAALGRDEARADIVARRVAAGVILLEG
jgi:hypothetical protein